MSNGINSDSTSIHWSVTSCFANGPQPSKITNVYEMLIMQLDHAHPRLQWLKTSNSGISCRNWRASRCSINSFIAETKSVNSY